jgi:acetolactate synthase regulatory subunit
MAPTGRDQRGFAVFARTPQQPDSESAPASASLDVEVVDTPEVVARVLTILCRRKCHLVALDYAADAHGRGHLHLEFVQPARHGHCVEAWIDNLVGVVAVRASP